MKTLISLTICACLVTAIFAQNAEIAKKEQAKTPFNKKQLIATWKVGNATYVFDKSGASLVTTDNRTCPEAWVLEGNTLTITPKKLTWKKGDPCSKTLVLEVESLSNNGLDVIETTGQKELHLTKQK